MLRSVEATEIKTSNAMRTSLYLKIAFMLAAAATVISCAARKEHQIATSDQAAGKLWVLQDEVDRLRSRLQSSRDELRILTNALGSALPSELRSRAAAAREKVYPIAEREQDLKQVRRSLQRAIAATDAEISVIAFHLRAGAGAMERPDILSPEIGSGF